MAVTVPENWQNYVGNGGRTWARTKDPLIKSQLLYQLSYASMTWPVWWRFGEAPAPSGGGQLAVVPQVANPFLHLRHFFSHQRSARRFWRSIDIRMPMQSSTVICAELPKLTRGRGMPTTGARPITIARLIAT